MSDRFQYAVLKYVPNVIRDEAINVGIIIRGVDGGEFDFRFLPRSATVRRLAPHADQQIVNNFAKQLVNAKKGGKRIIGIGHPSEPDFFVRASGEFTGNLQFTQVRGLLAQDLRSALSKLYHEFVAEPGGGPRPINYQTIAPYQARVRLWNAFRRKALIRKGLVEQTFVVEGKHAPWTFDLGYKNGDVNVINSVALDAPSVETNLGRALVLKGMLLDVRAKQEHAVHGTAVAQLPTDRRSTGAKEAQEILHDSRIKVVGFSELGDLIEVVAKQLR